MKSLKDFLPGTVVKPSHDHKYTKRVAFAVAPTTPDGWYAVITERKQKNLKPFDLNWQRYILARQCDCGEYQAYDLVKEIPSRRVKQ